MAEEHSLEAHKKTAAYQQAKERLLAKLARWGGVVRKPFEELDPAKRRAELQQQARELAARKQREIPEQQPLEITDDDIPF